MVVKRQKERRRVSAKRRADEHKTGFDRTSLNVPEGAEFFTLKKAGSYRIDIIPYEVSGGNPFADPGSLHFERTYFTHRGIGASEDTYVCPRRTANKKCPICDNRAELQKSADGDEDLIKSLLPKERQLFNVIDLAEPDKGVQIWDISFHLFGKLLDSRIRNADEDDNFDSFADLEDGMTLKLSVEEKSFGGNNYCEVTAIDFKPRKTPYDESILEQAHNLDEMLKVLPYKKLNDIFLQIEEGDEEDEEEEAPPKKAVKKKAPPVDEDEDEEEEEEDEPAPKKATKKAAKKVPPVDEDEDEEDEEEEDEPPKKAVKKPIKKKAPPVDEDEEEEDEDEDEPAPPKKATKKAAKKVPPVDEDEEEDEEEEDEPAPKKPVKKAAKKAAPVEEDEDEDDWEDDDIPFDDEEEEEAPPKKKATKKAK